MTVAFCEIQYEQLQRLSFLNVLERNYPHLNMSILIYPGGLWKVDDNVQLGNNTTYILCIAVVPGPSRSSLASLATLPNF